MRWSNIYSLEQLGSFLKKVRKDKGYTQEEFAEMLNTSHATLSAFENGKSVSSKTLMSAINNLGLRLVVVPKTTRVQVEQPPTESTEAGHF